MDFYTLVEKWASVFPPMMHTPGPKGENQRFFISNGVVDAAEVMRHIESKEGDSHPIVIMDNNDNGFFSDDAYDHKDYIIYFACHMPEHNDGHAALHAKREIDTIIRQFLRFLHKVLGSKTQQMKMGLFPDFNQINYLSAGVEWDSWYIKRIDITVTTFVDRCENDLIPDAESIITQSN